MVLFLLQQFILVLILLFVLRTLILHLLTWTYFARYAEWFPTAGYAPTVSIIKPVRGVDEGMVENFRTFCEQDYASPYEIIFAVEDPNDPCVPLIRELLQEYPQRAVRLVFSDPNDHRVFGKVKNMMAGYRASRYEVIVFSDADIYLERDFLVRAAQPLQHQALGLVTALPLDPGAQDWVAGMAAIGNAAVLLGLAPFSLSGRNDLAMGAWLMLRRQVFEKIGARLDDSPSEDVILAQRVRAAGYRVHLLQQPIHRRDTHKEFKAWRDQLLRWLISMRGYLGFIPYFALVTESVLWWSLLYLLLALFVSGTLWIGVGLLALMCGTRLLSTAVINWKFAHDPATWRYLWTALVYDLLKPLLLINTLLANEFTWRGSRYRLNRDHTFTRLDAEA